MNTNSWTKYTVRFPSLIASVALMSSCISHNQIAGDWALPSTLSDGVCPNISGRYANIGQPANSKSMAYLSCELLSSSNSYCINEKASKIDHVSIEKMEYGLKISAWSGEGLIASETITSESNSYLCKDGWLTIKSTTAKGYSSSAAEFATITRSFGLSQGQLLERKQTNGILFLILPIPASITRWYRYPLADERPNNSLQVRRP